MQENNKELTFVKLVSDVFKIDGYEIEEEKTDDDIRYDIIAKKDKEELYIECKMTFDGALRFLKNENKNRINMLIIPFKGDIEKYIFGLWYSGESINTRTKILDIYDLIKKLENNYKGKSSSKKPLSKIMDLFNGLNEFSNRFYNINLILFEKEIIDTLRTEHKNIMQGKKRNKWKVFEEFVKDFIAFYFQGYIGQLKYQQSTDNNLHRYDFIAPIATEKTDSYFMEIVRNCFNTRYIVFEAKCYSKKISQDEIWRTSKYLYKPALRSVAIVFTTSACDKNAALTQKGLLREQGKLILVIDKTDVQDLLDDPTLSIVDRLKDKLDDLMMTINA